MVSEKCDDAKEVYLAICGAGRSLGFVCAPALFQYMIPYCLGYTSNINIYKENNNIPDTLQAVNQQANISLTSTDNYIKMEIQVEKVEMKKEEAIKLTNEINNKVLEWLK